MVIQYKHTGKVILAASSSKDGQGDWIEGSPTVFLETKCRAEPAKGNVYITGADGKQIFFSSIVYMPVPVEVIKPGMLFEVWDSERLIVKGDVKQYSQGQLNARVWL